ncbi:DUF11 domain-containing protein [Sphingomonas crocodyli]|uniref:DUF11 domain-containing protein n=2 Tax=Sphingomonas crocodyli TaxID=1979270 RepID=A0A437M603_9SPHN|nr:DUF11 domain-containing protein [Sphingomonas crocodyli]
MKWSDTMTRTTARLAAMFAAFSAVPALAGGITLDARVLRVETVAGAERLTPAAKAVPGDHMVYVLAYKNTGDQAAKDVVLSNPIPADMLYRGAGDGGEPDMSVDGVQFGPLASLTVAGADGSRRPARLTDVRQLRWHLNQAIAPGASGQVSFHAVVR